MAIAVALASACALVEHAADADTGRTSSLSWVLLPGAESCAPVAELARAVEGHLRRPHALVSPALADASIEGRAEHLDDPPRWHAVVELRDRGGTVIGRRELDSDREDCAELSDTAALAIALMIDPDAILRLPIPPPARAQPQVVVERVETRVPVAAAPTWRARPGAAVTIGYGFLPSPSVGLLVDVTLAPPRFWELEAFGGAWASQTVTEGSTASTSFSVAFAGLALCPLTMENAKRWTFQACGGGRVGALWTASQGFTVSESTSQPSFDFVGSARVLLPIAGPLALVVRTELGVPLYRTKFVYRDAAGREQSIFDGSPVTVSAAVGMVVTLP